MGSTGGEVCGNGAIFLYVIAWELTTLLWTPDVTAGLARGGVLLLCACIVLAPTRRMAWTLVAVAVAVSVPTFRENINALSEAWVAACCALGGPWAFPLACLCIPFGCTRAAISTPAGLRVTLSRRLVLVAMAVGMAAMVAIAVLPEGSIREKVSGRLALWHAAVGCIGARPLTGHGIGSTRAVLRGRPEWRAVWYDAREPVHVQNDALETWLETGAIGVALWAICFWRMRRRPAALAVLVMGTMGFPLRIPATMAILMADSRAHYGTSSKQ